MIGPICIVGSTASGKTALTLTLAKCISRLSSSSSSSSQLKCSAISYDSIQRYKGLPISSAQPEEQELQSVNHSNVASLDVDYKNASIGDFIRHAKQEIEHLEATNTIPILVGGTFNYLRGLLFNYTTWDITDVDLIHSSSKQDKSYQRLKELDPNFAATIHPNDLRKVENAHNIIIAKKQKVSNIYKDQDQSLRYPNTIVIYIDPPQELLEAKIRTRFDKMHEQDKCIKEFEDFFLNNHEWLYNSEGNLNRSFGLLQSIGFKEFLPYLEHRFDHKNYLGISGSGDSEKFKKLFEECKTRMYHQTIRYSKKQRKFLFNSFFPLAIKNQIPILHLSGTLSQQETEERCEDFMRRTLFDQETPKNRIPDKFYCRYLMNHRQEQFNPIVNKICDICSHVPQNDDHNSVTHQADVFVRYIQWKTHLRSKQHRAKFRHLRAESLSKATLFMVKLFLDDIKYKIISNKFFSSPNQNK